MVARLDIAFCCRSGLKRGTATLTSEAVIDEVVRSHAN